MPVTHEPWRGRSQDEGVRGKRVLLVGYSHYCSDAAQLLDPQLTVDVVSRVVTGEETHGFWASIMHYFGFEDAADFWHRVGFINYVPGPIGMEDQKFAAATELQLAGAAERLLDTMDAQEAEVSIILSTKASWTFKKQISTFAHVIKPLLLPADPLVRADYVFEEVVAHRGVRRYRVILACHPQGAHGKTMESMVAAVLNDRDFE
jgi:hypothetical protein